MAFFLSSCSSEFSSDLRLMLFSSSFSPLKSVSSSSSSPNDLLAKGLVMEGLLELSWCVLPPTADRDTSGVDRTRIGSLSVDMALVKGKDGQIYTLITVLKAMKFYPNELLKENCDQNVCLEELKPSICKS